MPREPIPTWCYSLLVVRRGHRFLLVQERDHGQPWYLPAGRVEAGETFVQAAHREVIEEAGVPVALAGILAIQHTPTQYGARHRVIFLAHPADDTPPKSVADAETLQAGWFTLEELAALPLRGQEVVTWCERAMAGALVMPLEMLGSEVGV
jgi:ADP-ribose pyrophosphatase YjhB (NUDIX family)